ncbi:hypothetical protein CAEBREN_30563 [Caenorhabditis brenneri]|uniref:DUF5641 domain-containing protein n=1 Tax=Caenorhabditis brenneri TaxID=135651 RepID=G0PCZ3_CAEBE|nr:hypothetical protein CAEBREN_30563 [Caenorhabditis brenneri]
MVTSDSRSRSSSRHSGDSQPSSSGRKRLHGIPRSSRKSSKDTLKSSVVEPIESRVTKVTKKAHLLIDAGKSAIDILKEMSSEHPRLQNYLTMADALLLKTKKYAHKLNTLDRYVANKFNVPLMIHSPDKEIHLQDIRVMISEAKVDTVAKELQIIVNTIESLFNKFHFPCSPYVPSDEDSMEQRVRTDEPASSLPVHGNLLATSAAAPHMGANGYNSGHAQPVDARIEPTTGSGARDTPILRQSYMAPHQTLMPAFLNTGYASDSAMQQRDMEIRNLQQQLEKLHSRRRVIETETLENGSEFNDSYNKLQHRLASLDREKEATQRAIALEQARHQTNVTEPTLPTPIVVNSPQPYFHGDIPKKVEDPSVLDAVNMLRQDQDMLRQDQDTLRHDTRQSSASVAEAFKGLTALLTQMIKDKEEEKYADEYEDAHRGGADDVGSSQSPPEFTSQTPAPPMAPALEPQLYRSFDATKHLPEYSGYGDFDVFQSAFRRIVMADASLTDDDRYLLLCKTLKGKAAACLTHVDDPQLAIKKTFDALTRTFASHQSENSLLNKLANLPFHQSNPEQMRLDLVAITVVMERLKQKGIPENDKRTIWDITAKLPPAIQSDVVNFMVERKQDITHDIIIERIYSRIDALEMRKLIATQGGVYASDELAPPYGSMYLADASQTSHGGSAHKKVDPSATGLQPLAYVADSLPAEYFDPVTEQTLPGHFAPGSGEPDLGLLPRTFPHSYPEKDAICAVCDGSHHAMRCNLSSTEFRKTLREKNLCDICTGEHRITECRSIYKCCYCDGTHHMGACPKKEFYRNPNNLPEGVRVRTLVITYNSSQVSPHSQSDTICVSILFETLELSFSTEKDIPLLYVESSAQRMVHRPFIPHVRNPNDMISIRHVDLLRTAVMIGFPKSRSAEFSIGNEVKTLRALLKQLKDTLERMWKIWTLRNRHCSTNLLSVGPVVLMDTEYVLQHEWPLGGITKAIKPERDGAIRSAVVRCKSAVFTRSVCYLNTLGVSVLTNQEAIGNTDRTDPYKSKQVLPMEKSTADTSSPGTSERDTPLSTDQDLPPANYSLRNPSDTLNLSTDQDLSTDKLTLPFPDVFDIEGVIYALDLFPENTLPNIAEPAEDTEHHKNTLDCNQFSENEDSRPWAPMEYQRTLQTPLTPLSVIGSMLILILFVKNLLEPQNFFLRDAPACAYLGKPRIKPSTMARSSHTLSHLSPRECCRISAEALTFDN